jgi:hypothetical protein
VAHQQDGAVVIVQHLLQQIEGVEIEIVGGLVHDQEIAGCGEEAGEQQPRPLAAREPRDRHQGLALVEEEIAEIGDDVLLGAAHHDAVAPGRGQGLPQGRILGQGGPLLVEIGGDQIGAVAQAPGIRLDLPQQQLQQGGLAGAIGADDADAVAAHDAGREILQQQSLAEALGEIDGLDDELAAGGCGFGGELGPAGPEDAAGALGAQRLKPPAPALVAAAPGGDAAQIPILLGGDALLQPLGLALLALDQLLRPGLEAGEAGVELVQLAALEPEHAGREACEEGAIMADEEQRALEAQQHLLEPFDGRQVEVIGGLVQQQQIGIAGQRPSQGRAPALAPRRARRDRGIRRG